MSMLTGSVFVGFFLFALVPLNDAACWREMLEKGATHCQDAVDKTWHAVGSSWTNSECYECQCSSSGFSCCDGLPNVHVSGDCTVKYNYHTCTYEVLHKKDHSIPCTFSASG